MKLFYSMDKSIPDENSIPLKSGEKLYGGTTVKMIELNGLKSPVVTAKCHKIPKIIAFRLNRNTIRNILPVVTLELSMDFLLM
ncbi:MAG: hypothetical protein R2850_03740 [Bacteroidia bacterium]